MERALEAGLAGQSRDAVTSFWNAYRADDAPQRHQGRHSGPEALLSEGPGPYRSPDIDTQMIYRDQCAQAEKRLPQGACCAAAQHSRPTALPTVECKRLAVDRKCFRHLSFLIRIHEHGPVEMTATKAGRQPNPLAAFMVGCLVAGALLGPHQQLRSGERGMGSSYPTPTRLRGHGHSNAWARQLEQALGPGQKDALVCFPHLQACHCWHRRTMKRYVQSTSWALAPAPAGHAGPRKMPPLATLAVAQPVFP